MMACVKKAARQRKSRIKLPPSGHALSAGKRHALHVKQRL